jgi:hypothetical protein
MQQFFFSENMSQRHRSSESAKGNVNLEKLLVTIKRIFLLHPVRQLHATIFFSENIYHRGTEVRNIFSL